MMVLSATVASRCAGKDRAQYRRAGVEFDDTTAPRPRRHDQVAEEIGYEMGTKDQPGSAGCQRQHGQADRGSAVMSRQQADFVIINLAEVAPA
jgi:hypothetical protein